MSKVRVKKSQRKSKKGKVFPVREHNRSVEKKQPSSNKNHVGGGLSLENLATIDADAETDRGIDVSPGAEVNEKAGGSGRGWRGTRGWVVAKLVGNSSLFAAGAGWSAYTYFGTSSLSLAGVALAVLSLPFMKENVDKLRNKHVTP